MSGNASGIEPQVIRSNKLELVERLADDLAHEIKNPLHSMVINLEVLKRRITRPGGSEPDELMRYAGVLGSELDRVNRRIELLLRILRPDRGMEPTTLADTVEEVLELLELERERRSAKLRFHPAPVAVRGHLPPDLARQIVLNLVLEFLDALAPGAELTIRTEVEDGSSQLWLQGLRTAGAPASVGAGFDEAARDRLQVARALSEQLGGRIQVEDRSRESSPSPTTVVLSLPLAGATVG